MTAFVVLGPFEDLFHYRLSTASIAHHFTVGQVVESLDTLLGVILAIGIVTVFRIVLFARATVWDENITARFLLDGWL